jgi:replicative DNA helicase
MTPITERVLPHSLEAERSVLGAVLLHDVVFPLVVALICAADFFRDAHRRIFGAMVRLDARRIAIDFVTLRDELARAGELEEVGGPAYITGLVDGVPRSTNVDHYAGIIREKSTLRQLIFGANKTLALAYDVEEDASTVLAAADRGLREVAEHQTPQGFESLDLVLRNQTMPLLERAFATKTGLVGLSTGFPDLDRMTRGLAPGTVTVIAGNTSTGKTSLATEILRHIAVQCGQPLGMFTVEMTKAEIGARLLTAEAGVDGHRLMGGLLSEPEWRRVSEAMSRLAISPLYLDDTGNISVPEIRARGRRLQQEHGCAGLVVDYVQLIRAHASSRRDENRALELGEISRSLKGLAKELSVPIIVLSQFSRAAASRPNHRPQLSDLRESGALEQDADCVLMLYRDETAESRDLVEIIIGKNRNGPTGSIRLRWIARETRFANLDDTPAPQWMPYAEATS